MSGDDWPDRSEEVARQRLIEVNEALRALHKPLILCLVF